MVNSSVGPGGAQVVGVQAAVGREHLAVPDPDARPGRPVDLDPQPAGQVLAEVDDVPAVVVGGDAARGDLLGDPDRRPRVGDQRRAVTLANLDRPPVTRAEARHVPAGGLEREVVPLAHQQVRVPDRAGRGLPLPVRDDPLLAAVGQPQYQLGQQFRGGAVVGAGPLGVEAVEAGVPPVGQDRAEDVIALVQ